MSVQVSKACAPYAYRWNYTEIWKLNAEKKAEADLQTNSALTMKSEIFQTHQDHDYAGVLETYRPDLSGNEDINHWFTWVAASAEPRESFPCQTLHSQEMPEAPETPDRLRLGIKFFY